MDTDSGNVVFELDQDEQLGRFDRHDPNLLGAGRTEVSADGPGRGAARLGGARHLDRDQPGHRRHGDQLVAGQRLYQHGTTLDNNAVLLGSFTHFGLLNAGDFYTQSQLVTLPINLLGAYNLFVVTNATGTCLR